MITFLEPKTLASWVAAFAGENAIATRHESFLDGTNPAPSMWLQILAIATGALFLFSAIEPAIRRARDFPTELAEPLKEALKTPDLRNFVRVLCELKGAFECRWSDKEKLDDPMPSFDQIGSVASGIKEDTLRALIESELNSWRMHCPILSRKNSHHS